MIIFSGIFLSGNKSTLETKPRELGIDVSKALLEFHEKYYSANMMSLTVIGKGEIGKGVRSMKLRELLLQIFNTGLYALETF